MKKLIIMICMVASVFGVVFAQGQNETAGNDAKKTLTIIARDSTGFKEWMAQGIKEFEADHPEYDAIYNQLPSSEADYDTKTALMLQTDDSFDVIVADSFLIPSLVASDVLEPINTTGWTDWETQFSDTIRNSMSFNGKTYGIPYDSDTRGLYYNVSVLKKAGIEIPWEPKSWDDILDAIRKIKETDAAEFPFWMNGSKAQGEATTMQTFEMLLSGTDDWIYEDGKWVVKSKGFTDSLKFLQTLQDENVYTSADLAEMLDANSYSVIGTKMADENNIGILLDGYWRSREWNPRYGEDAMDYIKLTPMPKQYGGGFTSMSGGWVIVINKLSKNKEAAQDFVRNLSSFDSALVLVTNTTDMTVRKDVMEAKEYTESNPYRAAASYYTAFTNFRPGNELYPAVSIEIQNAVESVITGQATAEQAANTYAKNVRNLVGNENCIEK